MKGFDKDTIKSYYADLLTSNGLTVADASTRLRVIVTEIGARWGKASDRPTEKDVKAAADAVAVAATTGGDVTKAANHLAALKAERDAGSTESFHHLETEAELLRWFLESHGLKVSVRKDKGTCKIAAAE
jgi:hypothetical protein